MPSKEQPPFDPHRTVPPGSAGLGADLALDGHVAAIAGGDSGALDELFSATAALVLALASRILRDANEAEEAALDVYRYVWDKARTYDRTRGSVKSWLMTITRGRSLDRVRARRARAKRERLLGGNTGFETPADPHFGPVETVAHDERDAAIDRAMRGLTERERRVIDLAFFRGLTHSEIAEQTGDPLGTIKSQIRRGLVKLHRLLKNLEDEL